MDTLLPVDAETPRSLVLDPPLTDAQFQELCFARRGATYDSNGGFFLPDGSMLNPDASYLLPQKLKGLTKDDLTGLPYLCPDFIIELLSPRIARPRRRRRWSGGSRTVWRWAG